MSETNKRITDALTGAAAASVSPSTNDIMEMLVKMLHSQTTGFDKLMKASEEQSAALKEQNAMLKEQNATLKELVALQNRATEEQRAILNRIADEQDRMMLHITNTRRPVVAEPSTRNMQAGNIFDYGRS
ncbi:hypothetical protein GGH12_004015 [Coemansia sp. RSA 1822]|nr:hypothetical protein LPJ76_000257 [Coemansia sp. RSA 638]KAJ2124530.1 hypothetical protein IW147_001699 [Coemansia sp. RSA 720]KAJ2544510.1 hypothetical protein GGF49_001134 [Coemansia sp. RSA 1853]KAJ2561435.1 hypothetical protein GGH12_004015 [Coemansia sp. RSA 1822]